MLEKAGRKKIFVDHGVSGAIKSRPELDRLLDQLPEGDVVVTKIDRLGRDLRQMLDQEELIHERNADIISLAEPEINTTAAAGKLMFSVFAIVAQFERDRLAGRTRGGLVRAKTNGTRSGRPKRLDDNQVKSIRSLR